MTPSTTPVPVEASLSETVLAWQKISAENAHKWRYGRDPGEADEDRENELLNRMLTLAAAPQPVQGELPPINEPDALPARLEYWRDRCAKAEAILSRLTPIIVGEGEDSHYQHLRLERLKTVEAVHTWIRDDAPLSIKMVITPVMIDALVNRLATQSPDLAGKGGAG